MQQQTELDDSGSRPNGGKSSRRHFLTPVSGSGELTLTSNALSTIKGNISSLVDIEIKRRRLAEDLTAAIKTAAEQSGFLVPALTKYVKACAGEKYDERKRESEQLSLLFDECGE